MECYYYCFRHSSLKYIRYQILAVRSISCTVMFLPNVIFSIYKKAIHNGKSKHSWYQCLRYWLKERSHAYYCISYRKASDVLQVATSKISKQVRSRVLSFSIAYLLVGAQLYLPSHSKYKFSKKLFSSSSFSNKFDQFGKKKL